MIRHLLFSITAFVFSIGSYSQIAYEAELTVCDDDNNGFYSFDLTSLDLMVLGGQDPADFLVSYYESEVDADFDINRIMSPYANTTNPQTIYSRVTDASIPSNYDTNTVDLRVFPSPIVFLEEEYLLCDDGSTLRVDTGLSISEYNFEWFLNDVILSETFHSLTISEPGNYKVKITSIVNGCISEQEFIVNSIDCTDSDSDGVIDIDEDPNSNGNLNDDDTDVDGIPNYLDHDDDGDNVLTSTEVSVEMGRISSQLHTFIDTDDDLIENYLDNDDDGDGILTKDEDYNNNGDPTDDDTDGNSIPDYLDAHVAMNTNELKITSLRMYPNPSSDLVTVETSNPIIRVSIYDIFGKSVYDHIHISGQKKQTLSVRGLQRGVYFVKLEGKNLGSVKKLIIN